MPLPYSSDFRWRVVWLYLYRNNSAVEVAKILYISERTVYRYAERFRLTGGVRLFAKKDGPAHTLSEHEELYLLDLVLSSPGMYLQEAQLQLFSYTGTWVHESTICRTLRRLGLSRQKIEHLALQRSETKRITFMAEVMMVFQSNMCLWIDETGCDKRNAVRKRGYAIRGRAPRDFSLKLRGKRYSAISILSKDGIEDTYITQGSVNGEVFLDFIQTQLVPLLSPFNGHNTKSVVILDNVSIHHVDTVVNAILSTGALLRFLPAYSPDFNPIELVFGEMKQYLRTNNVLFETSLSINSILLMALNSITNENCQAYIHHAGYNL